MFSKISRLKARGLDEVINYQTTSDWHFIVSELTFGRVVERHRLDQPIERAARDICSIRMAGHNEDDCNVAGHSGTITACATSDIATMIPG